MKTDEKKNLHEKKKNSCATQHWMKNFNVIKHDQTPRRSIMLSSKSFMLFRIMPVLTSRKTVDRLDWTGSTMGCRDLRNEPLWCPATWRRSHLSHLFYTVFLTRKKKSLDLCTNKGPVGQGCCPCTNWRSVRPVSRDCQTSIRGKKCPRFSSRAITPLAIQWRVASPPGAAAMYVQDLKSLEVLTLGHFLVDADSHKVDFLTTPSQSVMYNSNKSQERGYLAVLMWNCSWGKVSSPHTSYSEPGLVPLGFSTAFGFSAWFSSMSFPPRTTVNTWQYPTAAPQKNMEDVQGVQGAVSRILCQPSPSWAQLQKSAEISESKTLAISDPRRDTFDDKTWRHGTATAGGKPCASCL